MKYKLQPMFWDMNESTGLRHITLEHDGRVLFVVTSNRYGNVWTSSLIPMGFKMSMEEAIEFSTAFSVLPELMQLIEKPSLTMDEVSDFILTI